MMKLNKVEVLVIAMILLVVLAIVSNFWYFANYLILVPLSYCIGFTLVMTFNAIKNVIKDFLK